MAPGTRHPAARSEEVQAGLALVLGLTLAVGGMAAAIGAVVPDPMLAVGVPALVLGLALAAGRRHVAGWAGVAVWLILVPKAHGEALAVPLLMAALCLAIAVGPGRLIGWLGQDALRTRPRETGEGWIEEPRRPG